MDIIKGYRKEIAKLMYRMEIKFLTKEYTKDEAINEFTWILNKKGWIIGDYEIELFIDKLVLEKEVEKLSDNDKKLFNAFSAEIELILKQYRKSPYYNYYIKWYPTFNRKIGKRWDKHIDKFENKSNLRNILSAFGTLLDFDDEYERFVGYSIQQLAYTLPTQN